MKRHHLVLYFFLSVQCVSCTKAQTSRLSDYADGFPIVVFEDVIYFESIVNQSKKMTKQEALDFVYYGDTSRLSCSEKVINMENEREFSIVRELYMPEKCFKLQLNSGLLISYTSYDCQNINRPLFRNLIFSLYDRNWTKTDSLIVYRADEYDFELTGLLSRKNDRIFLLGKTKANSFQHAELIHIEAGKFVLKKQSSRLTVSFDTLDKYIAYLNWSLH